MEEPKRRQSWLERIKRRSAGVPRRKPPGPLPPDGVPADPHRPPTLTGGAAAALSFED